jgi:hypothetical protein
MARLFSARTLALGGLAIAAAGAIKNRDKVAGLIGSGSREPEPYPRPAEAPVGVAAAEPGPAPAPAVANVDAAGPPENTATAVPAPDPQVHDPAGAIDELAEERAAAAEAANIGGPDPVYAGDEPGEPAEPRAVALEESGEGVSEGLEQGEADLAENAAPDPSARVADVAPPEPEGAAPGTTSAAEKSANVWRSDTAAAEPDAQDTVEQDAAPGEDDGAGSEWQTWSGRAVEP